MPDASHFVTESDHVLITTEHCVMLSLFPRNQLECHLTGRREREEPAVAVQIL